MTANIKNIIEKRPIRVVSTGFLGNRKIESDLRVLCGDYRSINDFRRLLENMESLHFLYFMKGNRLYVRDKNPESKLNINIAEINYH